MSVHRLVYAIAYSLVVLSKRHFNGEEEVLWSSTVVVLSTLSNCGSLTWVHFQPDFPESSTLWLNKK